MKSACFFFLLFSFPLGSEEIYRLITTASILFYFLYHSQKTQFPVDIDAIKQFVSKARAELEGVSREIRLKNQISFRIRSRLRMIRLCKLTLTKEN